MKKSRLILRNVVHGPFALVEAGWHLEYWTGDVNEFEDQYWSDVRYAFDASGGMYLVTADTTLELHTEIAFERCGADCLPSALTISRNCVIRRALQGLPFWKRSKELRGLILAIHGRADEWIFAQVLPQVSIGN